MKISEVYNIKNKKESFGLENYNVPKTTLYFNKSITIPKQKKTELFLNKSTVGPTEYSPTSEQTLKRYWLNNTGKIDTKERKTFVKALIREQSKLPGPGQYNANTFDFNNKKGYTMGGKNNKYGINDDINIGPGYYNPKVDIFNRNIGKFDKSKRIGDYDNNNIPGPGNYNINNTKNTGGYKFSSSKRDKDLLSKNDLGPGEYNYNVGSNKRNGYTFSKRRSINNIKSLVPGPGQYNYYNIDGIKKGSTFGKSRRKWYPAIFTTRR